MMTTKDIMIRVKSASRTLAGVDTALKNKALIAMADAVVSNVEKILSANARDMANARGTVSDVMLDRLMLNESRIIGMADGIRHVVTLDDPVGKLLSSATRDDGLIINKVSVPMGVVAIIYESRPNVTSDAAALAVKSGNACILRCGKEAHASAKAITEALCDGLENAGLSRDLVMLVDDTSRDSAKELMRGNGYVDLLIPRGGPGLIRACVENATVPCIETGTGICHIYVDAECDFEMAINIIENAKTSRPSVCNAAEVCIVHSDILEEFIPLLEKRLVVDRTQNPVTLKMDERTLTYSKYGIPADDEDFDTEFLDYILAVKTVDSVEEAVDHILNHSTGHSESIITDNKTNAEYFMLNTDSAAVYVNASTRFTDGGEFGLGCEMGISTQKLHARGPMGLSELTSYKYIITGNGNIR